MELIGKLNNLDTREAVRLAVDEAVGILHQIESSKEDIKDIASNMKEEFDIKPAEFNKIVATVYKNNLSDQKKELDDLGDVIETLTSDSSEDNED